MQGVGGDAWRDVLANLGRPGLLCAPFLRITSEPPNRNWLKRQVHRSLDVPLSVQLLGNHPRHLAEAARSLADVGVDVVDLNLGCPSRQVVRKRAGAGLLASIDAIAEIVGAMREACHTRLSVKLRAGIDSTGELVTVAKTIAACGADFLVLHPRTREQGYSGVANWDLVKLVKSQVTIPVVGNGDVWYARDALRLLGSAGVDAVMIGRAALRNPFIFRQIDELRSGVAPYTPTGRDILDYVDHLSALFGGLLGAAPHGPAGALKEQVQFLLRAVEVPARTAMLERAMRASSTGEIQEAIRPLADLELDLAADGHLRLESTPVDPV